MRVSGYGSPDLNRALYSAANVLTLMMQNYVQPFYKTKKADLKTNVMHHYKLPWAKDELLSLGEIEIETRVTLSYFIEPSPGEIGWKDRYRYPSHGLRFEVKNPLESDRDFLSRISKDMQIEENYKKFNISSLWIIGSQNRNKGSVHSDIWRGTAAQLAESDSFVVYPCTGWWKERTHLKNGIISAAMR